MLYIHLCECSEDTVIVLYSMCFVLCRTDSPLYEFLESCLRHKSEMVIYEAAHAIVNMKQTTAKELAPAVSVLQLFCGSSKPTLRFAAVRTLNKVTVISCSSCLHSVNVLGPVSYTHLTLPTIYSV